MNVLLVRGIDMRAVRKQDLRSGKDIPGAQENEDHASASST
jgi:hypothetical protein